MNSPSRRPGRCRKLVGESHAWRIRVGDYRVLYEVLDDRLIVTVVRVGTGETSTCNSV
ncbi:type II toxin-antitoxin system RelE family toxin [Specibacter cremeus]|uniref:type II toxin-antitoxin system RelE family toxin n=1 Tax=Specibacter cremeus TaxID=1629051 RepID=UPI000F793DD7|nr:type II toxin-antitoxin system RelE/ParE family toxin [Specibacter cremeus]